MTPDIAAALYGFVATAGYLLVGVGVVVVFVAIVLGTAALALGRK